MGGELVGGFAISSDFPSQPIRLSCPFGAFETGRVQVVMHSIAQVPVCVANVYGYSPGPTWPRALAMTDDLLVTLTKELVLGKQGLRIIAGDFNHSSSEQPNARMVGQGQISSKCRSATHSCLFSG